MFPSAREGKRGRTVSDQRAGVRSTSNGRLNRQYAGVER